MDKPWWEYLLEALAGLFTKGQLEAAGAGPDAIQSAVTTMIDLPTLSGLQGPPPGLEESRDLAHCHQELRRRYAGFEADYEAETGRKLFITCTWRSRGKQFEYFKCGREERSGVWVVVDTKAVKTKLDGFIKKGRHNVFPSEAIDVCADTDPGPGKHLSWDPAVYEPFARLAAKHGLIWGGDWNGNGSSEDERFVDRPHLELPAGAV